MSDNSMWVGWGEEMEGEEPMGKPCPLNSPHQQVVQVDLSLLFLHPFQVSPVR